MVAANPVTERERRFARLMAGDQERIVRLATAQVRKRLQVVFSRVIRAYRQGLSPDMILYQEIIALADMFGLAMTVAHLQGIARTQEQAPLQFSLEGASAFLRKRMGLSATQTKELTKKYTAAVSTVVPRLAESASRRLQDTVLVATAKNLHVRDGVKLLKKDFERFGLSPGNPYAVEAVFRTQTAMAYSAGRFAQEQAPEIQEILWGWKYVTVGDDRVRDSHVGFDGAQLPKDDDFWATSTPPNGWACRCTVIAIFDEGKSVQPKTIDGVKPEPDKGFNFHPGKVLGQRAKTAVVPPLPKKPPKLPRIPKKVTTVVPETKPWEPRLFKRRVKKPVVSKPIVEPVTRVARPTVPIPVRKPSGLKQWKKTVSDKDLATQFNAAFGTTEATVSGLPPGVGSKAMRSVGNVVDDLKTRFTGVDDFLSARRFKGVDLSNISYRGPGARGHWDPTTGRLQLVVKKQLGGGGLEAANVGRGAHFVDATFHGITRHELGHGVTNLHKAEWDALFKSQRKTYWKKSVSEYGATNGGELAAESFSAWTHPGYAASTKKLPKAVEELLERTVGKPRA